MIINVLWFVAALLLAHMPVWLLRTFLYIQAPLFNYDYFLGVALMMVSPWAGSLALVLAYGLTWLIVCAFVYRFTSWSYFFDNTGVATSIDWSAFFSFTNVLALAVFAGGLWGALWCARRVQLSSARVAGLCAASLLLLGGADALNGSADYFPHEGRAYPVNIGGSGLYIVQKDLRLKSSALYGVSAVLPQATLRGQFDVLGYALAHPHRSVLLVAVESMGVPVADSLAGWLRRQVQSTGYLLQALEVPFKGATNNATLRTLCGLDGSYIGITQQTGRGCFPWLLQKEGWQTVGYHGFTDLMFNRSHWWPLVGLSEMHFMDTPGMQTLPRCGGMFNGICDEALMALAFQRVLAPKTFAYVLTLDTHLPVQNGKQNPADLQDLCGLAGVSDSVCTHLASLGRVVAATTQQASAMPAAKKPLIVLLGDHAPPFLRLNDRNAFKQAVVPAYVLQPQD